MMMVPNLGPVTAGANVTPIVQFAPGGGVPLQVSVSVKSKPEARMSRMRTVELLVLVIVAGFGGVAGPRGRGGGGGISGVGGGAGGGGGGVCAIGDSSCP